MRRYPLVAGLSAAAVVALLGFGYATVRRLLDPVLPAVAPIDLLAVSFDSTPIDVTITVGRERIDRTVTADNLRLNVTLWRSMHLADWNSVPTPLRHEGLDRLLQYYRSVLDSPRSWDRMSASDWDTIAQPVRTVAYRRMVAYWSGYYDVGARFDLSPRVVADTLAAVVMSESWFDHRGLLVNPDGSRDIGLAGASDFARDRMRQLQVAGVVDVFLSDPDYYDPWKATRFVAIWMALLLDEAAGDLDLAVAAYHRGIASARDSRGAAYLETVKSRLNRFIRNRDAPPAWDYAWRLSRKMIEAGSGARRVFPSRNPIAESSDGPGCEPRTAGLVPA